MVDHIVLMKLSRIVLLALLLGLSSCAILDSLRKGVRNSRQVEYDCLGRPKSEVIEKLGNPMITSQVSSSTEVFYYRDRWCLFKDSASISAQFFSNRILSYKFETFGPGNGLTTKHKTFEIYSGMPDIEGHELDFKYYSKAPETLFVNAGLTRSQNSPDLIVLFSYKKTPQMIQSLSYEPVYKWIPGETVQTTITSPTGQTYRASTQTFGSLQTTGVVPRIETTHYFGYFLNISVYLNPRGKKDLIQLWKASMVSTRSEDDLRSFIASVVTIFPKWLFKTTEGYALTDRPSNDPSLYLVYHDSVD